ncbi:penicillin-binding protein, partial [Streptococcus pyogenes]
NRLTPVYGSSLEITSDVYRSMMTYSTNGYSEDWTMPNGLYRSGGFLYLSGTYASNTDYTNSVYNNLYINNTTTASSQTTSDDTSTSNDISNSTNTANNINHPSTDDKKTTH